LDIIHAFLYPSKAGKLDFLPAAGGFFQSPEGFGTVKKHEVGSKKKAATKSGSRSQLR
jgi:hypothetical protein